MHEQFRRIRLVIALTLFSASLAAAAAGPSPTLLSGTNSDSFKKPAWLSDLSLGVKESYDDNLFLSGVSPQFWPSPFPTPPAGSALALKNQASWVTTFSPKFVIDLAPLLADRTTLQTFSLGYTPDFAIYHQAASESYEAHRFVTGTRARVADWSLAVDNAFTYVHGGDEGPFYPGALQNAIGVGAPRERREQFQDRGTVAVRFDQEGWFVRPTASLMYYDLKTMLTNVTGYLNYADRYDANGGLDLGWKVRPQLALTLGYRYGHQYQQHFSFTPYSSSSDYQRILLGVEGRPWQWLEVKIQGGPDFRDYPADTPGHITPVNDHHPVKYYGEALLTATLTPKDTLAFKYKQFQWVSSIGKTPYFDSCYDLSYRRKLTPQLTLDLGARLLEADYTSGNLATCQRDDLQYSASAGLGWAVNGHVNLSLAYLLDLGRNAQDNVVNPETRDYNHNCVSAAAAVKF